MSGVFVYCVGMGDFHTKDKGPPLTSNGQSSDTQVYPRGRGFCLGVYLHGLVHIDGSLHIPVCPPCFTIFSNMEKTQRGGIEFGHIDLNAILGGFISYYLIKQNFPQLTVMCCVSL